MIFFVRAQNSVHFSKMQFEAVQKAFEAKSQAYKALKEIMHQEHLVHVTCGDIGEHFCIWVDYTGVDGRIYERQFSWDKTYQGATYTRMMWIYNAFWNYQKAKKWMEENPVE